MKFNLKTQIVLNKEFQVEAEELKDAMDLVENQMVKEVDLNSLEMSRIVFSLDDPSIREYNRKACEQILKNAKK